MFDAEKSRTCTLCFHLKKFRAPVDDVSLSMRGESNTIMGPDIRLRARTHMRLQDHPRRCVCSRGRTGRGIYGTPTLLRPREEGVEGVG